MTNRAALLTSIAKTIQTYRAGEIPTPDADHVDRWVSQFTPEYQLPLLQEFDHVIEASFITEEAITQFLDGLLTNTELVGANPAAYWQKVNFLRVQQNGVSQRTMLDLMRERLMRKLQVSLDNCGQPDGDYIYLDDVMFTGNRVAHDLERWIGEHAPAKAKLHVIVAAHYSYGEFALRTKRLPEVIKRSGKDIKFYIWRALALENTIYHNYSSDVYWPTELPEDPALVAYANAGQYPFAPRRPGGKGNFFATAEGRKVLESEFFTAGMRIRSQQREAKPILRPLGYSNFGIGFGSTLATYRNCPNTAPLALWWGKGNDDGAMQWYPLLPRKTYGNNAAAENVINLWPR